MDMTSAGATNTPLVVLRKFEDLLIAKLEVCMQLQSLVDTSAQSLDAFRTHCSTSRELIKDEIRMLEVRVISVFSMKANSQSRLLIKTRRK